MIDGVAVSEPNVNPVYDKGVVIRQGSGAPLAAHSRPLIDYTTLVNVYQGCANYGRSYGAPPLSTLLAANQAFAAGTCASLAQLGLVKGKSTAEQAAEAQRAINGYGILPEQNELQPAYWLFGTPQGISVTYANAYSRASVADDLCGYSFAATSPASPYQPVALPEAADAVLFGLANGIPPTARIQLVNDLASGGPTRNDVSVSAGLNRQDQNLPGALCLRAMAADRNLAESAPLGADPKPLLDHLRESLQQIRATGKLRGIPTVIVQGRSDAILPPNHTSRPYYALSRRADGKASQIRYYEVLNAHHLDVFNGFPDFAARLVPLHVYFFQALDLMYDHLTKGTPLPPSQVVRTTPRGSAATPLSAANVPPVAATPAAGDLITFDGRTLGIPE
jgi:hydroxybutyrate-dimer hydrolase